MKFPYEKANLANAPRNSKVIKHLIILAQPKPPHAPRIRLASCISFCMIVTLLA